MAKTDEIFINALTSLLVENWTKENFKESKVKRIKGRFAKKDSFQSGKQKIVQNVIDAIQDIIKGKFDEIVVDNVRDDLEKYGGSNNIAFLRETIKGGIAHLGYKHNKDINGVANTLVNAPITRYVKDRKVFIEDDNYKVILSLDYFGKKKTWLLTGYKKEQ